MIDEIDGHYLLSLGYSTARITDPEKTLRELRSVNNAVQVQLVKAGLVAGPEHLRFAARNALHSFKGKNPRSKSLAVEYLLFVSCQRQISKAIKMIGVASSDRNVVLIGISESKDALRDLETLSSSVLGESDNSVVEIGSKAKFSEIQKSYGVTAKEVEAVRMEGESDVSALKRLIIEQSALLTVAG